MGWVSDIQQSIRSHGIGKDDIFLASGFFVGLNIIYITGLWSFCFIFKPTKNIVNRLPFPRLQSAFARGQKKAESWQIFKRLPPEMRGTLSISFCEMLTLKGLLGPVALPLKIWLAAKLTHMTKTRGKDIDESKTS